MAAAFLPNRFRRRYGTELLAVVSARLEETYRDRGVGALLGLWVVELGDLGRATASQWRGALLGTRSRGPGPVTESSSFRWGDMVRDLWADVSFAWRLLRTQPGFTVVAVLSLALGIGASTSVFSVINGTMLRPLPFESPERLMVLFEQDTRGMSDLTSAMNFLDWQEQTSSFESLAAWTYWSYTLTGVDEPAKVLGLRVSASWFDVLAVDPVLGRRFMPEEQEPGRDKVVVLTHAYWLERYGGDPGALGQTMTLDDEAYEIVGIMPAGFMFPDNHDVALFRPLALFPWEASVRAIRMFDVIGRLDDKTTIEQARAEFQTIATRMGDQYPDTNEGWSVSITPAQESLVGNSQLLFILLGAVGFVLLIASANIASLLLARARVREREIAIRTALGARRGRVARQLLAESVLLGAIGGALGIALALVGSQLLVRLDPGGLPRWHEVTLDGTVAAFAVGATLLTVLVFGVLPALHLTRPDLTVALHGGAGGRTTSGRRALATRRAVVVVEVALVMVLLAGAGLLTTSFLRLMEVRPGFDAENLLVARLDLSSARWADDSRKVSFFRDLVEHLEAVPGIVSAGMVTTLPMNPVGTDYDLPIEVEGRPVPQSERPQVDFRLVSPGYMETMGIPLLEGRQINGRDGDEGHPPVVMINKALADRHFPDGSPVGQRISLGTRDEWEPYFEIVGVVGDVHHRGLDVEARPEIFMPWTVWTHDAMTLVVRTDGEPLQYAGAVKRQVHELDALQPVTDITTARRLISDSTATRRANMLLLGGLAAFGILIAAIGIYGVITYDVGQRRREFAVRMAMGAERHDVVGLVMRQGLVLTAAGVVLGLAASMTLTRVIEGMLYDVGSRDPLTIGTVVALLGTIAMGATYLPARRATTVDPARALRDE
jgi:putative ABC transport system permease protein